jgi:O-antigen ligase
LLALVLFLIGFGTSAPFLGGANISIFTSSLNRDNTLTGRTEVWEDVLPAMRARPLLGYGFGSFWTDARRALYLIPTAHNGYLDILLQLGEVGLVFYAVWLLSCARQLHRALSQDYDWASLAICFLIMGLVYNATESALSSLTEPMTAVIVLASVVVLCESDRTTNWTGSCDEPECKRQPVFEELFDGTEVESLAYVVRTDSGATRCANAFF